MAEDEDEVEAPLIGARMSAAVQAVSRRVLARLHAGGFNDLRPAHITILRNLWPEGLRMSDLADRAGITKPSAAYLVDELERRGYVERKPQMGDKRVVFVQLSARGWAAHRTARAAVRSLQDEWTQVVGEEEMHSFLDTLTQLSEVAGEEGIPERPVDRLRGRPHREW